VGRLSKVSKGDEIMDSKLRFKIGQIELEYNGVDDLPGDKILTFASGYLTLLNSIPVIVSMRESETIQIPLNVNRTIALRYFQEVWSGNSDIIDELVAPDCTMYGGDGAIRASGPAAIKEITEKYACGFPDLQVFVEDIASNDDRVFIIWSARGTHTGQFKGIAPTRKHVVFRGIQIYRIIGKKIVEERYVYDSLDLYQQLGVVKIDKEE
jgi:predicted ester cyclase